VLHLIRQPVSVTTAANQFPDERHIHLAALNWSLRCVPSRLLVRGKIITEIFDCAGPPATWMN
jgi:hypothetical protein